MSKVIAGFSMSLDGFIADPDHGTDHVFRWYSAGGTDAEIMTSGTDSVMTREASEFIEEWRIKRFPQVVSLANVVILGASS